MISVYSLFMGICWPRPQSEKALWPLNAQKKAALNVPKVHRSVSKSRCIKSKKEVSGDLFVSSCHTCLSATSLCYNWLCSCVAKYFMPYICKYNILEATKQIFVYRNDSSVYVKRWKSLVITQSDYLDSHLRLSSSAVWLVLSWTVTYGVCNLTVFTNSTGHLYHLRL